MDFVTSTIFPEEVEVAFTINFDKIIEAKQYKKLNQNIL